MLLKLLLAASLAATPIFAVSQQIYEGGWKDGATVQWACSPGTDGKVVFQVTLPDGKTYAGTLSCGTGV
jgi:hypothetical protein